jgi:hypothetical protein
MRCFSRADCRFEPRSLCPNHPLDDAAPALVGLPARRSVILDLHPQGGNLSVCGPKCTEKSDPAGEQAHQPGD